jgi:hypothetical protein
MTAAFANKAHTCFATLVSALPKRLTFLYGARGNVSPLFYILIPYKEDRMPLSH